MTGEKSAEFRGKTVDAAVNAGLASLRLSREEVEIEVVRPGNRGLLGIGAEDAIVRLTQLRPARTEAAAKAPAKVEPKPTAKAEPPPSPAVKVQPAPAAKVESKAATKVQSQGGQKPESTRTPRPDGGRRARTVPESESAPAEGSEGNPIELGRELLSGLLEHMGITAEIEITEQSDAEADESERAQVLNIVGDELGALIGRQNEVLSALEFITRLMVNQRSRSRSNFIVDANGYRAKRAEALRKLALRTAEQVVQTNRTMVLEPMPPAERRIIHLALRDHPTVATQSVGEGDHRKVTIVLRSKIQS